MKKAKIKLEDVRRYYRDRMLQLHALRNFSNKYQVRLGRWRTKRRQKADELSSLTSKIENKELEANFTVSNSSEEKMKKINTLET